LELIKMEFGPLRSALFNFMESVYGPIARSTDVSFNGSSKILIQILCKELSDICMKMYEKDRHKNVVILNTLPLKWFRTHDRVTISVDVIVTLLHYLHLLSHSDSKNSQYLLCSSNYLTASLATLLFHCEDEVVHGNVICLLHSIICVKEFSENLEIWNLFSECHEGLQKDIDVIEAVIVNDTARLREILSENSNVMYKDRLNRNPLHWAVYFGTAETVEVINAHFANNTKVNTSILENYSQRESLDWIYPCEGTLRVNTEQDELSESKRASSITLLQKLHFSAEVIPVLLLKYQQTFSVVFRYDCERNEIEMFRPFYAKTDHSVKLESEKSADVEQISENSGLQMSLCDWLGTCGGTKTYFINPGLISLVEIYSILPDGSAIDTENESFIGQNEIHIQHPILKKQQTELFDTSILEGKYVGSRLYIDTGLDLIPTAYCLSCICDRGTKSLITNWCLQGSNNANEWINLSVHINDYRIMGKSVTIPLNPLHFKNTQSNHLIPLKMSFRFFRIMDLSPLSQQSGICVCGLDFYGEIVGVHPTVNWIGRTWNSPESHYIDKKLLLSQMRSIKQGEEFISQQHIFTSNTDYRFGSFPSFIPKRKNNMYRVQFAQSIDLKTKKRLPKLRCKLVAMINEERRVASVEIDKGNLSILKYATRLAEILVKRGIKSQTTLTLEYYLSNNREEEVSTITDDTNELLQLISLLHQMIHSFTVMATCSDEISFEEYKESKSSQSFSLRLYRLLEHQLADIVSTGLGLIPHWCDGLNHQLSVLVPFEMRQKLFRACGLGNIRSLMWIKHSVVPKPELCKLGLSVQPFQIETQADSSDVMNILEAYLELLRQIPSQSEWSGTVTTWTKKVYRDITDGDDGRLFWYSAERLMDNLAEVQFFSRFIFGDENGMGEGLSRDFYSELSREFCRKSGGMWLGGFGNENSLFVHTPFGLFPAPYPRDSVPLQVLIRFHILALFLHQDGYLLDLSLSKPFLKIIINYSNAVNIRQNKSTGLKAQFLRLEHLENCREQVWSDFDFIQHCNFSGSGNQHWLTGLLDVEDFLILYPYFKSTLPGLIELYKRQKLFCKTTSGGAKENFDEFMNKSSEEIFGCTLENLGLVMVFHCPHLISLLLLKTTPITVKLRDIYTWEFPQPFGEINTDEDGFEQINNDNYIDYVKRLLEFALDKGIRAQMEAFVVGFERVFPLKWLSMFTTTEVVNLICGQQVYKPWTRDELLLNIKFIGFDEDSNVISYFLETLLDFNEDERRNFLRFVTGYTTLPMGGWQSLSPMMSVKRMQYAGNRLYPLAHSCFNQLFLPEYTSLQELRDHLLFAISQIAFLMR
uniref:E3 ubiquitin-protein ligase n=2 Tax=Hymenolepis diminuta TaxID=6216 RepID=A0A0R3S9L4_HYMDI